MVEVGLPARARVFGPRSRALSRGAIGDLDGRTRMGRFLRQAEQQLLGQLGAEPSFTQIVLARQVARAMFELEAIGALAGAGEPTSSALQAFLALSEQVRLGLRDLGVSPRPEAKA